MSQQQNNQQVKVTRDYLDDIADSVSIKTNTPKARTLTELKTSIDNIKTSGASAWVELIDKPFDTINLDEFAVDAKHNNQLNIKTIPQSKVTGLVTTLDNKIEQSELTEQVNQAIEDAKKSGAFAGAPGKDAKINPNVDVTTTTIDSDNANVTINTTTVDNETSFKFHFDIPRGSSTPESWTPSVDDNGILSWTEA